MTAAAIGFGEPPVDPVAEETGEGLDGTLEAESPFVAFVDEIDAWARRALAANGFGDPL